MAILQTLALLVVATSSAFAQGSAFTYQGRLLESNSPASGLYEMQFTLFDASTNGNQIGTPLSIAPVAVSNGLFTALLDFGSAPFNGGPRWLEITVRIFGSGVLPTTLVPRQPVTPTPYALFASTAGTVPDGAITAPKLAGGAAESNLRAGGLSAVASGGVVLSEQASAKDLLDAGYIKMGRVDLIEESWLLRSNGPALLAPPALARAAHSAVWTGSEMIMWGGTDGAPRNNGARYNPVANTWTSIPATNVIAPRFSHAAVWTGSEVIIHGGAASGFFGGTVSTNTGARYNPATGAWTAITPGGGNRRNHVAFWTGSRMLVWGGTFTSSGVFGTGEYPSSSGALYDPASNSWTPISNTNAPSPRLGFSAVWTGTELIIWGGYDFIGSFITTRTNFNDGARYNVAANTWTPINTIGAPYRRDGHSAVWSGSQMIIWGGRSVEGSLDLATTNYNDGARYNLAANTWSGLSGLGAPTPRYDHTAVWAGDRMVMWGGTDGTNIFDSGARYFPTANAWSNMTATARPASRNDYTTVWSGSEMIIWGGFNNFYFDIGGGYNPVTDIWRATAPTGERSQRRGHTAIWTGTEFIVWGGFDGERYLNTGGRFNPALNSWIPMSTNSAPTGRIGHTAVWTGTQMIIWGGTSTNSLNSGGRYNPASDTWTATAPGGAPLARYNHSAVWTGDSMIIWGGADASFRNTGGRYNPIANTWVATPTTGAPSARSEHTAVWTGNEMVVWGGVGGTLAAPVPLATGARYNPTSNSWAALPAGGAPAARTGHKAVWSGDQMVVWGGTDLTTNLNTGGRYHVISNSWSDITTNNAPSPRVEHTAVWDGTRMIVWGGFDENAGTPYLYTGGVYNPLTDVWLATQVSTNTPLQRSQHAAAWTGDAMIIHAGWRGSVYMDDTYQYAPPRTMFLYLKP